MVSVDRQRKRPGDPAARNPGHRVGQVDRHIQRLSGLHFRRRGPDRASHDAPGRPARHRQTKIGWARFYRVLRYLSAHPEWCDRRRGRRLPLRCTRADRPTAICRPSRVRSVFRCGATEASGGSSKGHFCRPLRLTLTRPVAFFFAARLNRSVRPDRYPDPDRVPPSRKLGRDPAARRGPAPGRKRLRCAGVAAHRTSG